MKRVEIIGELRDGKPYITAPKRQQMYDELSTWKDKTRVIISVEPVSGKRSLAQNSYLHGYLFKEISKGLIDKGWNRGEVGLEVVKMYMKSLFLKDDIVNEQTGEAIQIIKNTSGLNKEEFWEFCDNCIRWATENLGIEIMMPGEQSEISFDNDNKV